MMGSLKLVTKTQIWKRTINDSSEFLAKDPWPRRQTKTPRNCARRVWRLSDFSSNFPERRRSFHCYSSTYFLFGMDKLPVEVLTTILEPFDVSKLAELSRVSSRWNKVCRKLRNNKQRINGLGFPICVRSVCLTTQKHLNRLLLIFLFE